MNPTPPAVTIVRVRNSTRLIRSVSVRRGKLVLLALALAIGAKAHLAKAGADGGAAVGNRLLVRVVGLRNDHGDVRCTLFSSDEDFPINSHQMATTVIAPIAGHIAICGFSAIAPGTYAVVLFHDENSDGKFNRDWLGLPKEGYGFSNDAPTHWHAPTFDAARFPFTGGIEEILVHVRY
jgi:uncharacterized protein (DUF2141 family)